MARTIFKQPEAPKDAGFLRRVAYHLFESPGAMASGMASPIGMTHGIPNPGAAPFAGKETVKRLLRMMDKLGLGPGPVREWLHPVMAENTLFVNPAPGIGAQGKIAALKASEGASKSGRLAGQLGQRADADAFAMLSNLLKQSALPPTVAQELYPTKASAPVTARMIRLIAEKYRGKE